MIRLPWSFVFLDNLLTPPIISTFLCQIIVFITMTFGTRPSQSQSSKATGKLCRTQNLSTRKKLSLRKCGLSIITNDQCSTMREVTGIEHRHGRVITVARLMEIVGRNCKKLCKLEVTTITTLVGILLKTLNSHFIATFRESLLSGDLDIDQFHEAQYCDNCACDRFQLWHGFSLVST